MTVSIVSPRSDLKNSLCAVWVLTVIYVFGKWVCPYRSSKRYKQASLQRPCLSALEQLNHSTPHRSFTGLTDPAPGNTKTQQHNKNKYLSLSVLQPDNISELYAYHLLTMTTNNLQWERIKFKMCMLVHSLLGLYTPVLLSVLLMMRCAMWPSKPPELLPLEHCSFTKHSNSSLKSCNTHTHTHYFELKCNYKIIFGHLSHT